MARHSAHPRPTIPKPPYPFEIEGTEEGRAEKVPDVVRIDEVLDRPVWFFVEAFRQHPRSIIQRSQPKSLREGHALVYFEARVVRVVEVGTDQELEVVLPVQCEQQDRRSRYCEPYDDNARS